MDKKIVDMKIWRKNNKKKNRDGQIFLQLIKNYCMWLYRIGEITKIY